MTIVRVVKHGQVEYYESLERFIRYVNFAYSPLGLEFSFNECNFTCEVRVENSALSNRVFYKGTIENVVVNE